MIERTLPVRAVTGLLRSADQKGFDIDKLLDGLKFPFNPFDPAETDRRIPVLLYCQLLQQLALHSQHHLFGLPMDEDEPTSGLRLMCLTLVHCQTLGQAIERAEDFYRLYGHPGWRFTLERIGNDAIVRFSGRQDQEIYAYDMSSLLRLWSWLSGQYIVPTEVKLVESRRSGSERYQQLFECDVQFGQSENMIRFDANTLNRSIVHTEESLDAFLPTVPYELIVLPRDNIDSVTSKVRFIIGHDFTKELPNCQEISVILHISYSTLQRKLAEEGTTYQQIKDEMRKEAAIGYLSRPDLTINTTAYLMGFIESSAFSRTFKRWTGMPPGLYRKIYLGIGDLIGEGSAESVVVGAA